MLAADHMGPTLCIGEILAEIVATAPGKGFTEPLEMIGPYPSGAPAIFIDQCARMGGRAAMVGAVGDDDFGRLCLNRLAGNGVDTSAISVVRGHPTGTAFVRYRPDGNRDFVFNMWTSAAGQIAPSESFDTVVARAGHLHVMGTLIGNPIIWPLIEAASLAIKSRGGTLSFDPNLRPELQIDAETSTRLAHVLSHCDLLLPSDQELFVASGTRPEDGEARAIAALTDMGVAEIVVKRGPHGATAYGPEGDMHAAPAFQVDEVDPTGAGDCFGGAYVAARRLGLGVDTALTYASAAGARNVTVRGPMEGAGTRDALDAFIATTARRG